MFKFKQVLIIISLLVVIATGTFIIMSNNDNALAGKKCKCVICDWPSDCGTGANSCGWVEFYEGNTEERWCCQGTKTCEN